MGGGKIRVARIVTGGRRVPESKVESLMGIVKPDASGRTVVYCSFPLMIKSGGRLGWAERNCWNTLNRKGYEIVSVLENVASGLTKIGNL